MKKNFFRKNIWNIVFVAVMAAVIFIPDVRAFVQRQLLMKPTMEKLDSEVTLTDADYDIVLRGMNVPDTNLKDLKGKTIFLNFWGTWCPPCRAEFPSIQKLYNEKKDKVNFVLIAMQDKEESVRKFLEEGDYNVPAYIADSPMPEKFLVNVFPTTLIIGADGRILKKEDGAADWNSASVHQFIDTVTK